VTPSNLCLRAAMLLVLAGMVWGLQMAITDDHSAFPAHAHLNLLGFVAFFLFGIFYRLNPTVEANRLAIPQVLIWIVSTIVTAIGVGLVHTGHPAGDPIAAVGSLAIFGDAILFTWLVFQAPTHRGSCLSGRRSSRLSPLRSDL
jgi:peptidoglycan/LPS O-acetylase OafA/YrhL